MGRTKLEAAKAAAAAAIDQILDGTWFAVIAGTHQAYLAYPYADARAGMVRMDAGPALPGPAGGRASSAPTAARRWARG